MRAFELYRPESLADARRAAAREGAELKAAGTDLIDRLQERLVSPPCPTRLVDLLPFAAGELGQVRRDAAGAVTIGSLVTLRRIAEAPELAGPAYAALREAAGVAATPAVRNRATLGGNLLQRTRCWYYRSAMFSCAHDGSGDRCLASDGENRYHAIMGYEDCVRVHPSNLAPALSVLGAEVAVAAGVSDVRTMPFRELFPRNPAADEPEHTLAPGEILLFAGIPAQPPGARSAYAESREKQSFDWPTTAAAVRLVLEGDRIREASICLGAVAPVPMPREEAAAMLVGKKPSPELFENVAAAAFAEAEPLEHNAYKVAVGRATLEDALAAAARKR